MGSVDGLFWNARQFRHPIPNLEGLRPITLRPTFSGGLPFFKLYIILFRCRIKVKNNFKMQYLIQSHITT
jgi:hypothetical protein